MAPLTITNYNTSGTYSIPITIRDVTLLGDLRLNLNWGAPTTYDIPPGGTEVLIPSGLQVNDIYGRKIEGVYAFNNTLYNLTPGVYFIITPTLGIGATNREIFNEGLYRFK